MVQSRELATGDQEQNSLGQFSFGPIKKPRVNYPLEIQLFYDRDGLVKAVATDAETGEQLQQTMGLESHALSETLTEQRDWVTSARINE